MANKYFVTTIVSCSVGKCRHELSGDSQTAAQGGKKCWGQSLCQQLPRVRCDFQAAEDLGDLQGGVQRVGEACPSVPCTCANPHQGGSEGKYCMRCCYIRVGLQES